MKQSSEANRELFKSLFGEATSYWTFPYLPWLNLYPRNTHNGNRAAEPLNGEIQKALSKSWLLNLIYIFCYLRLLYKYSFM